MVQNICLTMPGSAPACLMHHHFLVHARGCSEHDCCRGACRLCWRQLRAALLRCGSGWWAGQTPAGPCRCLRSRSSLACHLWLSHRRSQPFSEPSMLPSSRYACGHQSDGCVCLCETTTTTIIYHTGKDSYHFFAVQILGCTKSLRIWGSSTDGPATLHDLITCDTSIIKARPQVVFMLVMS